VLGRSLVGAREEKGFVDFVSYCGDIEKDWLDCCIAFG
jgi:hypothetical protein